MRIAYEVHYNQCNGIDYRETLHFVLIYDNFDDASRVMKQIQDEGCDPVLQVKPLFEDY